MNIIIAQAAFRNAPDGALMMGLAIFGVFLALIVIGVWDKYSESWPFNSRLFWRACFLGAIIIASAAFISSFFIDGLGFLEALTPIFVAIAILASRKSRKLLKVGTSETITENPREPSLPKFLELENGLIRFTCGYCNQLMEIEASAKGREITCPKCNYQQKVPTPFANRFLETQSFSSQAAVAYAKKPKGKIKPKGKTSVLILLVIIFWPAAIWYAVTRDLSE